MAGYLRQFGAALLLLFALIFQLSLLAYAMYALLGVLLYLTVVAIERRLVRNPS